MRNSVYFICILMGICQRIFKKFTITDFGLDLKSVTKATGMAAASADLWNAVYYDLHFNDE
jgi:hypothetical protein